MKQMARQLLASEAEEEASDQLHIRQANLADRFGGDQGLVQELFANLEALAKGDASQDGAAAEPATQASPTSPTQPPAPDLEPAQVEEKTEFAKQDLQDHPMLRPLKLRLAPNPQDHAGSGSQPMEAVPSKQSKPASPPLAPAPVSRTPLPVRSPSSNRFKSQLSPDQSRQVKEGTRQILEQNRKPGTRKLGQGRFSSLQDALVFSLGQFPLPKEIQLRQKPEHQTWLLSQVQACHNEQALRRFASSLSTKDLAILFPSLASLKTGSVIDKLLRIIALRASKYLYLQGWITLQYAYPRSTVQKGLALLCEILEDKNPRLQNLADLDYQGLVLGPERFDWESVHLISEISLPNTRHFMSSIIKYLRDSGLTGSEFFQHYGIYRDLALGQAIISQWDMAVFESNLHSNNPLQNLF